MLDLLSGYLPEKIYDEMRRLDEALLQKTEEIRLRAGNPVLLTINADKFYLGKKEKLFATAEDIREILSSLAEHSIYSKAESVLNGFFSVKGGIRVGVCGNFIYENDVLSSMNRFSSLNIRIPRAMTGVCRPLVRYISKNRLVRNTLILSPPGHGKTTLLRDLARAVASGDGFRAQNCSIIDERSEIAGTYEGGKLFDLGEMSDVMNGARKPDGIRMAIRTMAPEVIVTDEIGDSADLRALMEARNCGVTIIATAHADDMRHLLSRLVFKKMADEKMFDRYVLLGSSRGRGTVEAVYSEKLVNIYPTDGGAENENSHVRHYFDLHDGNRSQYL
jgi:stage III sporulation protein AA